MNCLWQPCLLMDRDEISNLYRGPSIDASYQVSFHMAKGFQRRRLKCEKLKDDRRRRTEDGCQKLTLPLARWAKKGERGYILKIITKLYVTCNDDTISFCYKSLITILVVMMMMMRRRRRWTVMMIWNILRMLLTIWF